jgi:CBS domain-containing protein
MATVEDILVIKGPDVILAGPDSTVMDAARLMAEANVGSVLVQDGENVVGIFTERDLLRRVVAAGKDPGATALGEVMSKPVRSCSLSEPIRSCAEKLTGEHIRHMVVIEDGALIGLIGLRDVMAAEIRESAEKIKALETLLAEQDGSGGTTL